eukprot:TRINITY_DN928_c0_g1_i1.p1 TRINITY_DN928_c0_g1~~TRINITY_DN928_c0_g1_i1.p1  ORF type:complete len:552 (+),score=94.02 TRINITY_DN928_c0_g1_i1:388-2043(+)
MSGRTMSSPKMRGSPSYPTLKSPTVYRKPRLHFRHQRCAVSPFFLHLLAYVAAFLVFIILCVLLFVGMRETFYHSVVVSVEHDSHPDQGGRAGDMHQVQQHDDHTYAQHPSSKRSSSSTSSSIRAYPAAHAVLEFLQQRHIDLKKIVEESSTHRVQVHPTSNSTRRTHPPRPTSPTSSSTTTCTHVVVAATTDYVTPLVACVNSVQIHASSPVCFHVLTDLSDGEYQNVARVLAKVTAGTSHSLEVIGVDASFVVPWIRIWEGWKMHANPFNFVRFFLPLLFPTLDRVVYLDPDMVVRVDINELLFKYERRIATLAANLISASTSSSSSSTTTTTTLERRMAPTTNSPTHPSSRPTVDSVRSSLPFLAAVPSLARPANRSTYRFLMNYDNAEIRRLVDDPAAEYFNAGLFVTDLEVWRSRLVSERLVWWMHRNLLSRMWRWGSQGPLALVFYRSWFSLESVWNFRHSHNVRRWKRKGWNDLARQKVLHFTGHRKPWTGAGSDMWSYWCPYFPSHVLKPTPWFCATNRKAALLPTSPWDYRFVPALRRGDFH